MFIHPVTFEHLKMGRSYIYIYMPAIPKWLKDLNQSEGQQLVEKVTAATRLSVPTLHAAQAKASSAATNRKFPLYVSNVSRSDDAYVQAMASNTQSTGGYTRPQIRHELHCFGKIHLSLFIQEQYALLSL